MENSNVNRLIQASQSIFFPLKSLTRVLVSSADVIHAWTIPSMGVKVDALPGRLNQCFIFPKRVGSYTGQCSEICGANHSFIPIVAESLVPTDFIKKLKEL